MYYKITNKDCEVYQKLHAMRTEELQWEKENREAIVEKAKQDFKRFLGRKGQQNFNRVTEYAGFEFLEPEKVDLKVWAQHKSLQNIFVPNNKTKAGKEIQKFINNGLKGGAWTIPLTILGFGFPEGRFSFPYIEICNDVLVLFLDNKHIPADPNVIEITSKEFEQIRSAQ